MASGLQVASLFAKIGLETSQFERALRGVNRDLQKASGAMGKFQTAAAGAFKIAGAAAVAGVATLGTAIAKTTKAAADMEQGIADIRAVMGLTTEQTAKLEQHISDLGLDPKLKVSATEAAATVEMLAKNGLNLDQIMGGAARSAILLSNATGGDFAMSADLATDAMAIFGIKAEEMSRAVNGIVGTTQASKFSIEDYALALAQGGGVAASVGVDFEDFNASIAAISPLFASGSDAGTSFKTFLQRLVPQTDKAKEMMAELGIITADGANAFFDAQGNLKSMSEVAGIMQRAFSGLSEEQKNQYASTIFGTDAMRAAFALMEAGSGTIDKFKEAIGNTDAEAAAATRMDTFKGQLEILGGIIEALSIDIGRKFLPLGRRLVEWFANVAETHGPSVVAAFGRVAEFLERTIASSAEFAQSLAGRFFPIIRNLVGFVANTVPTAYRRFREIVDNVSDPGLAKTVSRLRTAFIGLGKVLASLAQPFKNAFEGLFRSLMVARGGGWANVFDVLIQRFKKAISDIGKVFNEEAIPFILEKLGELGRAIAGWAGMLWDWAQPKLAEFWGSLSSWFTDPVKRQTLIDAVHKGWDVVTGWASAIWTWAQPKLDEFWGSLSSWFTDPVKRQQLWDGIVGAWNWLTEWAGKIWDWAAPKLSTGWAWLTSWFTDPTKRQTLWDGIVAAWNWLTDWAIKIWEWAAPKLSAGWEWLTSWFTDATKRQQLWDGIVGLWNWLTEWAGKIWEWAAPKLSAGWQWLTSWFTDATRAKQMWDGIVSMWNWLTGWAQKAWEWMEPKLKAGWDWLIGWVIDPVRRQQLWQNIVNTWTGFTDWASAVWGDVAPGLSSFFTEMQTWIDTHVPALSPWVNAFVGLTTDISTEWTRVWPQIETQMETSKTNITADVQDIIDSLQSLFNWLTNNNSTMGATWGGLFVGIATVVGKTAEAVTHSVSTLMRALDLLTQAISALKAGDWLALGNLRGQIDQIMRDQQGTIVEDLAKWIDPLFWLGLRPQNNPAPGGGGGGGFGGRARGGMVTQGGWTWVGERGPELVRLPGGSHVFTNAQSAAMMGGASALHITLDVRGESALPSDRAKIRELAAALQREFQLQGARVLIP